MKKTPFVIIALFLSLLTVNVTAQKSSIEYFSGKWNVLVKGLPDGDTKMILNMEKKDSSLGGAIQDSTGTEISKFSKVELTDSSVTVYFTAQGYDVNLTLNKRGLDHVEGSMMGMFDVDGDRVKMIK
jgi:hypothetical protein